MNREVHLRIAELVRQDAFYQELLEQCEAMSSDYRRIRDGLPAEDRERLESYIAVCEELEYQRSRMAYAIGTQDGVRTGTAVLTAE